MVLPELVSKFIDLYPIKRFGIYRFMPVFFVGGATIEFMMIKWRPNGVNFYDTFREKQVDRRAQKFIKREKFHAEWEQWQKNRQL